MKKLMTLGLLFENDRVLFGMKKRGFGVGRWNGFGGKVKGGETIEESFVREYEEESTIKVTKYEKWGVIEFEFKDNPEILEVHFYKVLEYSGDAKETDEMKPQWFKKSEIPYNKMWPDDRYWMPMFLRGKKFRGKIFFENQDVISYYDLREVSFV
jgi:8-oxo-dGTP pyrophosphatase MutT (NUDIX family)